MSTQDKYPTDLTDPQWEILQPLLPPPKWRRGGPGRPPCSRRRVINGILYVTKTGCQWCMLPPSFGRWKTVYGYFNTWSRAGVWQQVMETLTQHERTPKAASPTRRPGVWIVRVLRRQPNPRQRVTMPEKESMAASGMPWSTPWG